jgi:hypothetical protein
MGELATFERVLWALTVFLKAALLALLLYRKHYRAYPLFLAYVLTTLVQSAVLFETYRVWGWNTPISARIGWGTQGVVILTRGLAVAEICQRILAKYLGIWALAWRILLAAAAVVLLSAGAMARGSWQFAILNADRGLELAIAVVIVMLFLFAHYYHVAVDSAVRLLATGFFLYSCFFVVNDTVLESWLHRYAILWNLLGTLAFLASLLLWIWVVREKQPEQALEPEMLSESVYGAVAPQINIRLKALNENLRLLRSTGGKRP